MWNSLRFRKVGCGFIHFASRTDKYTQVLLCNYYPGGNVQSERVYKPR